MTGVRAKVLVVVLEGMRRVRKLMIVTVTGCWVRIVTVDPPTTTDVVTGFGVMTVKWYVSVCVYGLKKK